MNLLGIDTSTDNISLSVLKDDKIIIDSNRRIKLGASQVMPLIEKLSKKAGLCLREIDAFVVGAGPGSFTGLRISFSIIKAFSLSLNKPVIRLGSFFSMALPFVKKHKRIAVIADARRGLIYAAAFKDKLKMEGREKLMKLEDFVKNRRDYFFIAYDKALREKVRDLWPEINFCHKNVWPKAAYLVELARGCYVKKEFTAVDKLQPLYLHPKTCQIRGKGAEVSYQLSAVSCKRAGGKEEEAGASDKICIDRCG